MAIKLVINNINSNDYQACFSSAIPNLTHALRVAKPSSHNVGMGAVLTQSKLIWWARWWAPWGEAWRAEGWGVGGLDEVAGGGGLEVVVEGGGLDVVVVGVAVGGGGGRDGGSGDGGRGGGGVSVGPMGKRANICPG